MSCQGVILAEAEQEASKYKPEAKLVQKVLAVTLNNLAELYRAQARYADAVMPDSFLLDHDRADEGSIRSIVSA